MKAKRHRLVVTITHNKPVTRRDAVRLFQDFYCLPGFPTEYYPDDEIEAKIVLAKSHKERKDFSL